MVGHSVRDKMKDNKQSNIDSEITNKAPNKPVVKTFSKKGVNRPTKKKVA